MSQISEQLRQRVIDAPCMLTSGSHLSLAKLGVGQGGKVCGVCDLANPEVARRLFDLGLIPGTPVVVRRQDPFGKTLIVEVGGYELALRSQQATCITIDTSQTR